MISAAFAVVPLALLAVLTGCGSGQSDKSQPTPTLVAEAVAGPVKPLPIDDAVVSRSGNEPLRELVTGNFGPSYVLYAKCVGSGELRVRDRGQEGFRWSARCDGVPSRIQVNGVYRESRLQVSTEAGVEWSFVVARPKSV